MDDKVVQITINDSSDHDDSSTCSTHSDSCLLELYKFNKKKIVVDDLNSEMSDCSSDSLPPAFDTVTQCERQPGQYYNSDECLPVYEWTTVIKSPAEVAEILLKPIKDTLVCRKVPADIAHNVCFLIDRSSLKSENDWKSDDLGSWRNNGVQRHYFYLEKDEVLQVDEPLQKGIKNIKRTYFKNNSAPDLKKCASFVEGESRWIFIQYLFDGEEHPIEPLAHRNCRKKNSTPYVRIKESTVATLKSKSSSQTPKNAYHEVQAENGGVAKASAISDLPRNRAQAKYLRRGKTNTKTFDNVDSLLILLEQCKRQQLQRDEQPFIREVIGAPEMRCVLGFDWQFRDIAKFCTDPANFSVLGADPTFNLGKFNATVTSFANLKVVNRVDGNHPAMIGPILLSQKKSFDSYNHFFSKVVSLDKDIRDILAFGTDGEQELFEAMKYSFPYAIHLRCFNHFRDNCKVQLRLSNIPEQAQKEFLSDIFGRRFGDMREKGLLDADDEDDLRTKLLSLKEVWNSNEQQYLPAGETPRFYEYISKKVEMMNESMSKEARRNAGLGDPPAPYYTNIAESANALVKRAVNFQPNEIADFCREMAILLSRQKEDVDSAVINKGPYRLAPAFSAFEISQSVWFKMNTKQREAHLKRFHAKGMSDAANVRYISPDDITSDIHPPEKKVRLSINLEDEGIRSVPQAAITSISEKAEKLLNCEGSIVCAPGASTKVAYMVESQTSERPHYVSVCKNGKVACEECPGWKASKICAHSIAVAEKEGVTAKYLKWLREKGPSRMHVTAMVTFDSSSSTGKKGGNASTSRRKGGRTAKQPPVTTVVDRPFYKKARAANTSSVGLSVETIPERSPSQILLPRVAYPEHSTVTSSQKITSPVASEGFSQLQSYAMASVIPSHASPSVTPPCPGLFTGPPTPKVGEFVLYLLQFCPPMVRSCYGCLQTLKPGGVIASPPHDLVIVSRMKRGFRATQSNEMMYKDGNVYFHLNQNCVMMKQPYFDPQIALLPNWLVQYLRPVHFQMLQQFGFYNYQP